MPSAKLVVVSEQAPKHLKSLSTSDALNAIEQASDGDGVILIRRNPVISRRPSSRKAQNRSMIWRLRSMAWQPSGLALSLSGVAA